MEQRLLELALQALQQKRAGIEAEIETLRAELDGTRAPNRQIMPTPPVASQRARRRTPAERKTHSLAMKKYWAAKKKAEAAKPAAQSKATAPSAKVRTKTDAEKKALSLKMKKAWKRRKAAAAQRSA